MRRFNLLQNKRPIPPHTCFFTGALLDNTTEVEHTILCRIGGRIKSTIVSSSKFNNDCGSRLDPSLLGAYGEIIRYLGPLFAREHQSGALDVEAPGRQGNHVLNGEGALILKGPRIERDPATHEIASFISNAQDLEDNHKKYGKGRPYTVEVVPPGTTPISIKSGGISPQIEACALKCILLSFDHALAPYPDHRFTRLFELGGVRSFIRNLVQSGELQSLAFHFHSLGLQYENDCHFAELRKCVPEEVQPFEHLLIASGDSRSQTIDAVFRVFGVDPFGFRLTDCYRGEKFTCLLINQPLARGRVLGPYWNDRATRICRANNRRSYPRFLTDAIRNDVQHEIEQRRTQARQLAIELTELRADETVVRRIRDEATMNGTGDHSVGTAIRSYIRRFFAGRLNSDTEPRWHTDIEATLGRLPDSQSRLDATVDSSPIEWPAWLRAYRRLLGKLRPWLGPPGDNPRNSFEGRILPASVHNLNDDILRP